MEEMGSRISTRFLVVETVQGQTDLEDLQRQVVTNNRMNLALCTGIQTD